MFNQYIEIKAKFASQATCKHSVKKGDTIGYNPCTKQIRCSACWAKWKAENQEASDIENGYMPNCSL